MRVFILGATGAIGDAIVPELIAHDPEIVALARSDASQAKLAASTRDEQLRRFKSRELDPLKQWKLSPIDRASLNKWDDYTEAKEAMFFYTNTADAPWTIVKSDDKKRARRNTMQHFLESLPYPDKNYDVVTGPDRLIVGSSADVIGTSHHIFGKSLHPDQRHTGKV